MGQLCKTRKEENGDKTKLDKNLIEFLKDLNRFLNYSSIKVNQDKDLTRESNSNFKKFSINTVFEIEKEKHSIFKKLEIIIKIIDTLQIIFKLRKKNKVDGLTLIDFDHFYIHKNDLIYYYDERITKKADLSEIFNLKQTRFSEPNQQKTNEGKFSLHKLIFESPKQNHEEIKSSKFYLYYLKRFIIKTLEKSDLLSIIKKDKEKLKHFSNISSLKTLKFCLGNLLFNNKEVKELKRDARLDFSFIKHNLDCIFPENNMKFIMLYDQYQLSSNFNNETVINSICIGCVEHYLSSMFPANMRGLRLSSCLEVWKIKSKLDIKVLINYLKYFNFTIDLDYKKLEENEIIMKSYMVEVYKKEHEPGLFCFEFSNNIDNSFRLSNTTNVDRISCPDS